jgi:fumarylpyruvate hydrolase
MRRLKRLFNEERKNDEDAVTYVLPLNPPPALPVSGSADLFPVSRIFCVGRNYAEHAREMGANSDRELPFFFMKPATAILAPGQDFPYPTESSNVHHEMELVVAVGTGGGAHIGVAEALNHVFGYAAGLDMTRRDLQSEAKKVGRPWEVGKAFDHSAPCSAVVPASGLRHPQSGQIWLDVNGKRVQDSDISQMIWGVPEIIAHLSRFFALVPGDLIFTGTPAGVGPVKRGDVLHGAVDGVGELTVRVV